MELRWLPASRIDIQRLYDFLEEKNPRAAERVVRLIREGAKRLLEMPEIGQPMNDEMGRRELFLPFGAGAYVLRYKFHGQMIVIIRVWHSREHRG
ncbi:MAG: type II toxin-antitoxin system RelE/ParE family toxin [Gammaproteobacteria bacterium]|nr:type II toxin-antitoxin system RelE/ParE family toxin [Gammaproteobacteria bacterium]